MSLVEVAAVLGVPAPPGAEEVTVTSVEFDSRRVRPGALFVALPGQHADGHDFAGAAAAAGAVAVLGLRPVRELPTLVVPPFPPEAAVRVTEGVLPEAMPLLSALSVLAGHVARGLVADGLTVVGVTGSAGKTSTKDLIAAVLATAGTVVAPPESFNNELGHPYTVLRADAGTDFLVLELSARGVGHIASLTATVPPRIGAVLNVGSAHLGEFGSREAIAQAKGELVEALPPGDGGGVAILNADDPLVVGMVPRTRAAIVTFGTGAGATVRATDVSVNGAAQASFSLVTPEGSAPVTLRLVGPHQVSNALAAAAVGRACGVGVATVAAALSVAEPASKWRMAVSQLAGGITLINDAYNANPESVRAALVALARIAGERRSWAVLGPMAELGAAAPAAHDGIGRAAAASGARVLAVGEAARPILDGATAAAGGPGAAGDAPRWVPDIDAALGVLRAELRPGDVVLVKASRSVGLERLAAALPSAVVPGPATGAAAADPIGQESA